MPYSRHLHICKFAHLQIYNLISSSFDEKKWNSVI
jgi:hypothetical protein